MNWQTIMSNAFGMNGVESFILRSVKLIYILFLMLDLILIRYILTCYISFRL
jgi:preprotein translocase subunit SecG